jgi:hypothetical protein
MRQRIWVVPAVLLVLGACGDGGQEGSAGGEEAAEPREVLAEPSCQPSSRMDVAGRASPYDSTTIDLGEGVAKICYGRPSLKGRTMIGGAAVPYDTLWRTGANEPTTLHVNVPATIAGIEVEPGAYALYSVPRAGTEWTLVVNRSTSQWGHESNYTEEVRGQEVGRAPVQAETLDSSVEVLTIRPMEDGAGALLEWQNTRVRIPIRPTG